MKVQSKLNSNSNNIVAQIVSVNIDRLTDTEIIYIDFGSTQLWIDTAKNVYARSRKGLAKAVEKSTYTGRHTVPLNLSGVKNNTRTPLYRLIAIADEIDKGIIHKEYCGLNCNHKDRTGNVNIYGYVNNRCYNLELVPSDLDDIHWQCIKRIQELTGIHVSMSACDLEKITACQYDNDAVLIEKVKSWTNKAVQDKYGTYLL